MPLEAPRLDDLQYDDLVRRARARIQRYTPEWTDLNDSDPGMTLVHLFAWLTEMIGVRLNQVPQRNYIKFLQLLNLELRPAQAAQAHLTFTVKEGAEIGTVPKAAQVAGQSEDGELVVFETDKALDLIPLNLSAVQVNDGFAFTDVTVNNEDVGAAYAPLGLSPQIGSALYLGFGEDVKVDEENPPQDLAITFRGTASLRVVLPESRESNPPVAKLPPANPLAPIESGPPRKLVRDLRNLLQDSILVNYPPSTQWNEDRQSILETLDRPEQPPSQLLRDASALLRKIPSDYPVPSKLWRERRQQFIDAVKSLNQPPDVDVRPRLQWEYRSLDDPSGWTRLPTLEDETKGLTADGYIRLQRPRNMIPSLAGKIQDRYLYWLRCRLVQGRYSEGDAPSVEFILPNTISATNLRTIFDEQLGDSTGEADQQFRLRHQPVERNSLQEILVDSLDDNAAQRWKRVEDIHSASQDDQVFQLNANTGVIRFGDGRRGLIPPAGSVISLESYRTGGGDQGNLPADEINTPLLQVLGVDQVRNVMPAVGGKNEQPLEDLKRSAPGMLRRSDRAVLADDFASLAMSAGGVAKATAIPLAHPDHPGVSVPGSVTVVILPDHEDVPPEPSRQLLRSVADQLAEKRLITTELYVRGPEFFSIAVTTRVRAASEASFGQMRTAINKALNDYLDPRRWEFGRELYPTELYGEIQSIEHVIAVLSLSISKNGLSHDDLNQAVVLPANGLVYGLPQHNIIVESEIDL